MGCGCELECSCRLTTEQTDEFLLFFTLELITLLYGVHDLFGWLIVGLALLKCIYMQGTAVEAELAYSMSKCNA